MSRTHAHSVILAMLAALILVLAAGVAPLAQSKAELALKAAMDKEVVDGDLKAAIKMYRQVARSGDRALAARALVRMGRCYEKLGDAEARKAYEQVVREFGDQAESAAEARARLAALAGTAPAAAAGAARDLTLTKIYSGGAYASSISPDGKRLLLNRTELSSRDLWIRDIATGSEIRLTNRANVSEVAAWSPDSRWIAFADRDRDITVVPADGGPVRTLFTTDPTSQDAARIAPTGWTSDSRKVIFHVPSKGLFAVPAAGGASEPILTFENPDEAKRHSAMTLSPNGRWIAYSAAQNGNTDIFVVPTTGKGPIRVTTSPAADRKPRWSPDGNWLAFTSSGSENPQLWAIKISPKGEPDGPPVQISKDAYVLGGDWTGGARVGISAAFRTEHIFTANADGTGEAQLTHFAAFNARPQWSPSGDRIAFRSDYRKTVNKFQLWTVPSAGGTPRLVSDKEVSSFLWSGDGEKLFFTTGAGSDRSVYMEAPANGGEPREIMTLPGDTGGPSRAPDGRSLCSTFTIEPARFATTDEFLKERMSGIGVTPAGGGEPRILIPADRKGLWYSDCRLSPDGKQIAYILFDYAEYKKEGMYSIWTMDVGGGAPRLVINGGEYVLCWAPDGKWIVFEKRIKDMDFDLYKVPANGGEPVTMNIKGRSPEFSPDGKRIAYSRRVDAGYEYWLVENVLPAPAGRAK